MRAVTEPEIRASFVNCSKGEAKRLTVPADLARRPWDDLDFLGWNDPGAPDRNYLVTELDGDLVGVVLRAAHGRADKPGLCAFCLTSQPGGGVRMMTAPRAGASGRQGNSVGTLLCADLACSLYVRGRRKPAAGAKLNEHLSAEQRIARTRGNLDAFLTNVLA